MLIFEFGQRKGHRSKSVCVGNKKRSMLEAESFAPPPKEILKIFRVSRWHGDSQIFDSHDGGATENISRRTLSVALKIFLVPSWVCHWIIFDAHDERATDNISSVTLTVALKYFGSHAHRGLENLFRPTMNVAGATSQTVYLRAVAATMCTRTLT